MRTQIGTVPEATAQIPMDEEQRRTLFMAASLLLDYPDDAWGDKCAAVASACGSLPVGVDKLLASYLDTAREWGRREMEQHYVDTFDQRRRCSLFLSYYAVGDTRQRGAAILAFKESLETLGFFLDREELPDHLCVVLEAAAKADGEAHAVATDMLAAHRDGIEVLRLALEQAGSPYAPVVTAVCAALPAIDQATRDNFVELIRQGPPAELVGIGAPLPFPHTHADHTATND